MGSKKFSCIYFFGKLFSQGIPLRKPTYYTSWTERISGKSRNNFYIVKNKLAVMLHILDLCYSFDGRGTIFKAVHQNF